MSLLNVVPINLYLTVEVQQYQLLGGLAGIDRAYLCYLLKG